jgi:hypothetical protein
VLGPDGTIVTFQNSGSVQEIIGPDGELLSTTVWTPSGPEPLATVQPAFAPAVGIAAEEAAAATIELGLALYSWYMSRNRPDLVPVIAFKAQEFQPGQDEAGTTVLSAVRNLTRDEVKDVCDRIDDVQDETNAAAKTVVATQPNLPPARHGTAVHMQLKEQIDDMNDPNFRAEVSVLKSLEETYGTKDSVRIDVFENTGKGTVCVYDIKTAKRGLSLPRSLEIATKVHSSFSGVESIVVIEIRPTR